MRFVGDTAIENNAYLTACNNNKEFPVYLTVGIKR